MTDFIQTIETDIKTEAEKIWSWFEEHVGITHTTQRAAQELNKIVPKPTPVIASPESQASSVSGVVSGIDTVIGG